MSRNQHKTKKDKHAIQKQRNFLEKISRYEKALFGMLGSKNPMVLQKLKNESFGVFNRVYNNVSTNEVAKQRFLGKTLFPKSYNEISNVLMTPFTDSIEAELRWIVFILSKFYNSINAFLQLKTKFESAFICGYYDDASEVLINIENYLGCSLWLIEAKLLLAEYQGGLKANRTFLNNINSIIEKNNNLCILASYLSLRAEKEVSYPNYNRDINDFVKHHKPNPKLYHLLQDFIFKLDFIGFEEFSSLPYIMHHASIFPIIDRYNTCLKVLQILTSNFSLSYKNLLIDCINYLRKNIPDFSLDVLLCYLDSSMLNIQSNEIQDLLLESYDRYTIGQYDDSLRISRDALSHYPCCFELYDLYAKSLLHSQKTFENPLNNSSISSKLLEHTYNILAKNDKTTNSIESMLKISSSLSSTKISNQILRFIIKHKYLGKQLHYQIFGEINAVALTPRFTMLMPDIDNSLAYLQKLKAVYSNSSTIDFFVKTLGNKQAENLAHIPQTRKIKYYSRFLKQNGEFAKAIKTLESLENLNNKKFPYQTDITVDKFECYLKAKQFEECLHLIVETYLTNRNLLLPINIELFHRDFIAAGCEKNMKDICWPIFESILQQEKILPKDNWQLYVGLDDFLAAIEINKPSKLKKMKFIDEKKLVYLLRNVCVPEILENTIGVYESTEEIENERIDICQILLNLDPKNESDYSTEIKRLMREQMTRKAIQHIDKRRVYIETNGVLNSLDKFFEERFNRCLYISRLDEILRKNPNAEMLSNIEEQGKPVVILSDASLEEFEKLFNEIKNRFISSNEYGLDSYLSVRIRHGTLSGQIRSQFENENLITRKDSTSNNYISNKFWKDELFNSYGEQIAANADNYFKDFSRKIDNIIEYINNKLIQIKNSENNNEGLFDFDYDQKEILKLWAKIFFRESPIDYAQFKNEIINSLWERTEENLKKVRKYILEILSNQLNEILDDLSTSIYNLHSDFKSSHFSNSIARCSTNIQNELKIIAEWFKIAEAKSFPDFNFDQLINTTLEMVRKCYPSINFMPEINVRSQAKMAGKTFESFVDLMFIPLENIARHSERNRHGKIEAQIDISGKKNEVVFRFSNIISSSNIEYVKKQIANLTIPKDNIESIKFIRREGGSGYYKLHKILRHDLACENSNVEFRIKKDGLQFEAEIKMSMEGIQI